MMWGLCYKGDTWRYVLNFEKGSGRIRWADVHPFLVEKLGQRLFKSKKEAELWAERKGINAVPYFVSSTTPGRLV